MHLCRLPLALSSISFMRIAALVTETPLSTLRLYPCPGDPVLWDPISSSSAELYFLSSIIISPVSLLACMLEPLNFYPTHPSWPLTLEPSITSWILIQPDRHVCYNCLHPALDLAVALAKFLFVCIFSCEDTRPRALVLSRQPLTRALP